MGIEGRVGANLDTKEITGLNHNKSVKQEPNPYEHICTGKKRQAKGHLWCLILDVSHLLHLMVESAPKWALWDQEGYG